MRILILKPSSLGDVATAMPMFCDLHAARPDAQIDWLIAPGLAALLRGHPAIHELIPFDRKKLGRWYTPGGIRALFKLLRTLRAAKYDIVIDAQGLLRSGLLTRITSAPIRIGFAHAREGAAGAYTHKVTLPEDGKLMLAVDRMRTLLGPLNISPSQSVVAGIPVHSDLLARLFAQFPETTGRPGLPPQSYVVLIPGARWDTKRWSIDGFTEIARRLLAQGDTVVLLGSPDESRLCDQIEKQLAQDTSLRTPHASLTNLAGRTTLAEMIAVLASARLVIGNDSGPLHVAVALGRPIVAAYGPTDPAFVGPAGQLDHVVRFDVPCFPCRNKICGHHSCMRGVTVEMMWEKTKIAATPRS